MNKKKIAVLLQLTEEELDALRRKTLSDINSQMVLIAVRTYIADVPSKQGSGK